MFYCFFFQLSFLVFLKPSEVGCQLELRAWSVRYLSSPWSRVFFLKSFQSCNESLIINQVCFGPYSENIDPWSFLYGPRCARPVLSRPRAIFYRYGPCTCAYISRTCILISSMVSTHISMMDHLSRIRYTLDFHHSFESFSRDHSFVVPSKLSQNVRRIRYTKSVKVKSFSLLWIL